MRDIGRQVNLRAIGLILNNVCLNYWDGLVSGFVTTNASTARRFAPGLLLALVGVAATAGYAHAQVMEIGSDGQVAVYDRPSVFTEDGAKAIRPPARPRPLTISRVRQIYVPRGEVSRHISDAAATYDLPKPLLEAIAWQESGFHPQAASRAGAFGVMQLMPGTARNLGVDRYDVRQNIFGGAAYVRTLLNQYGGDLRLTLAAYNAGPEAVRRHGGVPPYAETQAYVSSILSGLATRFAAQAPALPQRSAIQ